MLGTAPALGSSSRPERSNSRAQGLLSAVPIALDQQAGELCTNSRFDKALGWHLMTMARVKTAYGHGPEARGHIQQVVMMTRWSGETILARTALATLGLLELNLGRPDRAADSLIELATTTHLDTLPNHALTLIADAIEAATRAGRPHGAR